MPTTTTQPPAQQKPPPRRKPTEAQVIAAIIPVLLAAVSVAGITAALGALMLAAGIGLAALQATSALVLSMPLPVMEGTGPASRSAVRANTLRQAQFFLSAARRVQSAADSAKAHGEPVFPAVQAAVAAERRFFGQQVAMSAKRITAASAVDGMASMNGNLLGWNAVIDTKTTPGCRRANGRNFYADDPPVVEGGPAYPGGVHSACRCWPSQAHAGAPVLPGLNAR